MEHGLSSKWKNIMEKDKQIKPREFLANISKPRISALIVDDDAGTRLTHKRILENYNMEAKTVANGKEAVDLYQAGAYFDVILMDQEMPIMDGAGATKELRAMCVKSMIVAVTSLADISERYKFMASGLDHCFEKPLTGEMVEFMLQELKRERIIDSPTRYQCVGDHKT
ncbi:hypothetical protein L6164_017222 [Bauhinia variegata]|uniref:Uncharacterized protein n=1 Tax=Bauhinia variegata TaxID=167791 RepID=A0ACB9NC85_BAUVA|nr:hypothetical protein L6164_017222 [Bauhinia variegata]